MTTILNSELFIISLNLGVYLLALWIIKLSRAKYISALIIAIPIVIVAIHLLNIEFESYKAGSSMLNFLLGPSVVALGYLIHKNVKMIGRHIVPLILCVTLGAVVNSISISLLCKLFDIDPQIMLSLQPKSVTTPIALELSTQLGGIAPITILSVVFAGILGNVIAVPLFHLLGIKNPIARGAALGAASHAIGTSRALELGEYEGAISGLTIGIMGAVTALLLPYLCF